jgi:hypothetical protein
LGLGGINLCLCLSLQGIQTRIEGQRNSQGVLQRAKRLLTRRSLIDRAIGDAGDTIEGDLITPPGLRLPEPSTGLGQSLLGNRDGGTDLQGRGRHLCQCQCIACRYLCSDRPGPHEGPGHR